MKLLIALLLSLSAAAPGADSNSAVTGVWRHRDHHGPALVMTISDDGGSLAGALLFYGDKPGTPEPLFNLEFNGKAINFRMAYYRQKGSKIPKGELTNLRLVITSPDEARLHFDWPKDASFPMERDK